MLRFLFLKNSCTFHEANVLFTNQKSAIAKSFSFYKCYQLCKAGLRLRVEVIWWAWEDGGGSQESRFPIISSASQRDIVLGDKWRGVTVRGWSPLPPQPPLQWTEALCCNVLTDNHNRVLKPLIKFCSLKWYCFAMNPYEKGFPLGDYGSCGDALVRSWEVQFSNEQNTNKNNCLTQICASFSSRQIVSPGCKAVNKEKQNHTHQFTWCPACAITSKWNNLQGNTPWLHIPP